MGAAEYALVLYRQKLPKFRNIGDDGKHHMIFNWFDWTRDMNEKDRIYPAQKPIPLLKRLIKIFTDEGDIVIDPCAGSGSTLRAANSTEIFTILRSAKNFTKKRFYGSIKHDDININSPNFIPVFLRFIVILFVDLSSNKW